jgi:hypothetical protein
MMMVDAHRLARTSAFKQAKQNWWRDAHPPTRRHIQPYEELIFDDENDGRLGDVSV